MVPTTCGGLDSREASAQLAPADDSVESVWQAYFRILGITTAAFIASILVLDQFHCELRQEPTHWGTASLLVVASALTFASLLSARRTRSRQVLLVTSGMGTAGVCLLFFDLCAVHRALGSVLLAINTTAFAFILKAVAERVLMKGQEGAEGGGVSADETTIGFDAEGAASNDTANLENAKANARRWQRFGWIVLTLAFLVYMVIVPTIGLVIDWFTPATSGELTEMTLLESIRLQAVSGVVIVIVFAIGASIGSFLNVVVFRLPRHLRLLWPPSACVSCGTRLQGSDNLPVIAWLRLGGRCRYCGASIAARYPLVEAIVGIFFVVFCFRELLSGGANLPMRTPNFYNGIVWILLYPKWDLITLYVFHMLLLLLVLAWGLINLDQFRVPWRVVAFSILAFVGLATALPHLNPTHLAWEPYSRWLPASFMASFAGGLAGWFVGAAFNGVTVALGLRFSSQGEASRQTGPSSEKEPSGGHHESLADAEQALGGESMRTAGQPPRPYGSLSTRPTSSVDTAASFALVGAALGLTAVLFVAALTVVLAALVHVCRLLWPPSANRRVWPATLLVFVSTLTLLLCWSTVHGRLSSLVQTLSGTL